MKKIKNIKLSIKQQKYLILFSIFIMMLILNFLTPLIADDYSYSFGLENKRITNIIDIILKQADHYMKWGGRTVAHTIANFFLMYSKYFFNVANSLIYTLLVYLIYEHSRSSEKEKPLFIILIHFGLYFLTPVFGQTCIWLIGSCNYLWTTTIMLSFLLMYKERANKNDRLPLIIGMFFLGIVSGWTNENTAFGLIVITLLSTIIYKKKNKIQRYKLSGLIGLIIGFIIMIIAPGNYVRSKEFVDKTPLIIKLIERTINCTIGIIEYIPVLIVITVILITIYIYQKKKIDNRVFIFLLGAFFTIYATVLSPIFPERSWFGIVVFMLIAITTLAINLEDIHKIYKYILIDLSIITAFFYIGDYLILVKDIYQLKSTWDYRINLIETGKKEGQKDFEFYTYNSENKKSPVYGLADLSDKPHSWPNDAIELYYKIYSVKEKKE